MGPMERLQPLWPQFRTLPMQAINASLADIVAINGDWSTEDTLWFSERVVNHQFVSRIRDISYDPLEDNIKISVSLVDTTHPTTDIYIEKELVNDKRAVISVYNNNEQRRIIAYKINNNKKERKK